MIIFLLLSMKKKGLVGFGIVTLAMKTSTFGSNFNYLLFTVLKCFIVIVVFNDSQWVTVYLVIMLSDVVEYGDI